jgi:hypothetical protein
MIVCQSSCLLERPGATVEEGIMTGNLLVFAEKYFL